MRAGKLRQRIILQQKSVTRDDFGAEVETWATWATVWAMVKPMKGDEYLAARVESNRLTHRVEMRHRAGVTPDLRISFNGRVFEIEAVQNTEERNINLVLMCREMV